MGFPRFRPVFGIYFQTDIESEIGIRFENVWFGFGINYPYLKLAKGDDSFYVSLPNNIREWQVQSLCDVAGHERST